MNKFDRRNFVKKLGLGILGLSFISFNPIKLLSNNNSLTANNKINIKSNPVAVKRTNIKRF